MLKRTVLLTAAALAVTVSAGCTGEAEPAAAPANTSAEVAPSPAETTPASTVPTEKAPTEKAPTEKAPTASTTTSASKAPTVDPGDKRNWIDSLAPCPNKGQEPQIQQVQQKDATGDGATDTVIARTCVASTSYIPSTVEIFDGRERVGILLEDVGPTDLPWLRSMTVNKGTVTIEAYGVSESGVQACADLKLKYVYRHTGGTFERTSREETKVDDLCLPVG